MNESEQTSEQGVFFSQAVVKELYNDTKTAKALLTVLEEHEKSKRHVQYIMAGCVLIESIALILIAVVCLLK